MYRSTFYNSLGALIAVAFAAVAHPQAASNSLAIKAIAEVELRGAEQDRDTSKLVSADKVVPGDGIIYTLEVRNTGAVTLHSPTVTYPIPAHMWYVADSAVGPAAEVTYSIDGGRSFDVPENLQLPASAGQSRVATAAEYTHIRWRLKNNLKVNSVAFVRFRVIVKQ
jgi:uncharacterized repeat protein (TIGR01451 family)